MKIILPLLVIIASLIGIADAGYLTYEKVSGYVPPCHPVFKCGEVLASPWASIGPIPLSVFGLAFYTSFLVLGILLFLEVKTLRFKTYSVGVPKLMLSLGSFGGLFSLYLVMIMGVVLKAWCLYCLISAVNSLVLFGLSAIIYFKMNRTEA